MNQLFLWACKMAYIAFALADTYGEVEVHVKGEDVLDNVAHNLEKVVGPLPKNEILVGTAVYSGTVRTVILVVGFAVAILVAFTIYKACRRCVCGSPTSSTGVFSPSISCCPITINKDEKEKPSNEGD